MNEYPEAYIRYLVHFHGDRDWFECHELLEEYWKENPADARNRTWVGLIQIAVGLYHERRGNRAGAIKMFGSALNNLEQPSMASLGLEPVRTIERVNERVQHLNEGTEARPFEDMNLPIRDEELLSRCMELCEELGIKWESSSQLEDRMLIHRHTLRDRSEVIEARLQQAELRRLRRGAET